MKTLQELALQAVPNPGFMAKTYLVPWHPLAIKLEARDYEEKINVFREQHRMQFRYVLREMQYIERWYKENPIHPYVFRPMLDALFWIKDCHWLNIKTRLLMIML